jgi:hypothetical protein
MAQMTKVELFAGIRRDVRIEGLGIQTLVAQVRRKTV